MNRILLTLWLAILPNQSPAEEDRELTRRIGQVRVRTWSGVKTLYSLRHLGIRLCCEVRPKQTSGSKQTWIDQDGHFAFSGLAVELDANDLTVKELMTALLDQMPKYNWESVPGTDIINVFPRADSVLAEDVRAFRGSGNPADLIRRIAGVDVWNRGSLGNTRQVNLDFPGGSRRDFLNAVAAAMGDNNQWTVTTTVSGPPTVMWTAPDESCDVLRIDVDVRSGTPVDMSRDLLSFTYSVRPVQLNDQMVVTAYRRKRDLAASGSRLKSSLKQEAARVFYAALRALLRNDAEGFLEHCHTDGVRQDNRLISGSELRNALEAVARKNPGDYRLADLVDPTELSVSEVGNRLEFRIPVKHRLRDVFHEQLDYVLERGADRKWRIIRGSL